MYCFDLEKVMNTENKSVICPKHKSKRQYSVYYENMFAIDPEDETVIGYCGKSKELVAEDMTQRPVKIDSCNSILNTIIFNQKLGVLLTGYKNGELIQYGIDVVSILPGPIVSEIWEKNTGIMGVYDETDFGPYTKKADSYIEKAKERALPPAHISKLLLKIINTKKPKTRYFVGRNLFLTKLAIKYIPKRMMDKLIWKQLDKL